ncbi:hypothetical protein FACS1894200_10500 [Spirochaetia bacterium]|nr:hypothetical protein FACS1894200_10500 [Spirochaetia bacterium]
MRQHKYYTALKQERTIDGIVFASKAEMNRYLYLSFLQNNGKISSLELQPRFEIVPKTKRNPARHYTADFRYIENGKVIIEEVKGFFTTDYKLRRDLFLSKNPKLTFREVHDGDVKEY